ncbi:MAG TPA: tetratricopeptide repeat protein [Terriglobales bacterium]
MRRCPRFVLISLALAGLVTPGCVLAQGQAEAVRPSQIVLIMPFENNSGVPGIDWLGEAFPEVLGARLNTGPLFIVSRADRLRAFDRLGLPAAAKPSRATIYEIAQELDADYVLMGNYLYDGATLTVHAQLMNVGQLRLSPEMIESGPLNSLIAIQTSVAWDVLNTLKWLYIPGKQQYVAQFPPMRLDALESYIRGVIAGNSQERISHFKETARLDPTHTLAMLQLGKAYYETKDYDNAVVWLAKIPKTDLIANEAQFYLGLAAFYAGQTDTADAAFRFLAARLPLPEVYNNLGVTAARLGDHEARSYFEKSVQTDPNDPDYHFNLAVELYRQGRSQEAVRELKDVLTLSADGEAKSFLETLNSTGQPPARMPLERIKRNYDESSFRQLAMEIENSNEARLQSSDALTHAAFHIQRGHELMNQGLLGEAEKEFREAVILNPTSATAHAGLARVLESSQDPTGARNEARASLKLNPSAEAYLVLARLDLAENNAEAAQQDVEHALALDPANPAAVALKNDLAVGQSRPQP